MFVHKDFQIPNEPKNLIYISYSQFSTWSKCPLAWKLAYIDKIKEKKPGIHSTFGTAIHNIIQRWLVVLYTETVKKADEIDFEKEFLAELKLQYKTEYDKFGEHFSTKEELSEFYHDGLLILKWIRKNRTRFFDRKNEELIGIELPFYVPINGVCLVSYLDVVVRNKKSGKIIIKDIKTSGRGWSKWDKENFIKTSQLVLYKTYFAQQFNVSVDDIDIEYIITKRKVPDDTAYPIPRITSYSPASGSVTRKKLAKLFDEFISECFINGRYNADREYRAVAGEMDRNCRFCEFCEKIELCPTANRKVY